MFFFLLCLTLRSATSSERKSCRPALPITEENSAEGSGPSSVQNSCQGKTAKKLASSAAKSGVGCVTSDTTTTTSPHPKEKKNGKCDLM